VIDKSVEGSYDVTPKHSELAKRRGRAFGSAASVDFGFRIVEPERTAIALPLRGAAIEESAIFNQATVSAAEFDVNSATILCPSEVFKSPSLDVDASRDLFAYGHSFMTAKDEVGAADARESEDGEEQEHLHPRQGSECADAE
jgi:hypothetical protein